MEADALVFRRVEFDQFGRVGVRVFEFGEDSLRMLSSLPPSATALPATTVIPAGSNSNTKSAVLPPVVGGLFDDFPISSSSRA